MTKQLDAKEMMANLQTVANDVITLAKKLGADGVEVAGHLGKGFSIDVRDGEVDTLEYDRGKELSLTIINGKKKGSASTSDFSAKALSQVVNAANDFSRYAADDPYTSLPEESLLAYQPKALQRYYPWSIEVSDAIAMAQKMEQEALQVDKQISQVESAAIASHESYYVLANSLDFNIASSGTWHEATCSVIAKDKANNMQRDYDYTVARDWRDLVSVDKVAKSAGLKTVKRLGAKIIKTQEVPVIFNPMCSASLLSVIVGACYGSKIYRRSSFLLDKLGEKVFPEFVDMIEKPLLEKAVNSAAFDSDGVSTSEKMLFDRGVLKTYLCSTYSANQLGLRSTGNAGGVYNLQVNSKTTGSVEELMRSVKCGVYVTEMMGDSGNPVTGDFSKGASGFWFEDGEIKYPVEGITVAGNLLDLAQNILAFGDDVDKRLGILAGSMLVESLTVAGG
jgi:PmbA protein